MKNVWSVKTMLTKSIVLIAIAISTMPLYSQYTAIPDANFEQKLMDSGFEMDVPLVTDGRIFRSDAVVFTGFLLVNNASCKTFLE